MKRRYVAEIFAAIGFFLLLLYMIFTWKNLTPDTELSAKAGIALVDSLEGSDL